MPGNRTAVLLALSVIALPATGAGGDPETRSDSPFAADPSGWLDAGIAWCTYPPPAISAAPSPEDESLPLLIEADSAVLNRSDETGLFSGAVELHYRDTWIRADEIQYDRTGDLVVSDRAFSLHQPRLRLAGARARFDLSAETGSAEEVQFRLPATPARGKAAAVEIQDTQRALFRQLTYTTCPPGDSGWLISAKELGIDQAEGFGTARSAQLRFRQVPIAYLPYVTFPIDDRRKSGFLPPTVGQSGSTGFELSVPYYFNIAPNRDATLTPRLMTKRGLALGGEFRYLEAWHRGSLQGEVLPDDRDRDSEDPRVRGAFSYRGQANPAERWQAEADINYVSDDDYLADLGKSVALTSKKQLERRADLAYAGDQWNLLARVQDFQTIAEDAEDPYTRLPQLAASYGSRDLLPGTRVGLWTELVHFQHDERAQGQRFDIHPSLSLPLESDWGFLTPKVSGRYTAYWLEGREPGLPDTPDRTLGTFSLDSGLYFEREGGWFGRDMFQTLEPRLYYLYTPKVDQSELPVFDTAESTFGFNSLFRENRYSGVDRISDANQLSTALSTRVLDTGSNRELFSASLGQIIYFDDREVQLPGTPTATESSSAIVAEVFARLGGGWSTRGDLQWDPHASGSGTEKSAVSLHYLDDERGAFNLGYRYIRGELEDTEASFHLPVSDSVNLLGLWNYSLMRDETMGVFGGIEYNSCCWTVRAVVRQFVTDADEDPNLDIFVQLELKGLTSLGSKLDEMLRREIRGYEEDD